MPVEKFSEMLEEAGHSKSGSSQTVLLKDNASTYFLVLSIIHLCTFNAINHIRERL